MIVVDIFPISLFIIKGISKPYRLYRNRHLGGLLIYIREDIPSKKLIKHIFPHDMEGLYIEINLRKCKWFLYGTYHPPSQNDKYIENTGKVIDLQRGVYDEMLIVGEFNSEEMEMCIDSFLYEYSFKNLVKQKTCFKNPENVLIFF